MTITLLGDDEITIRTCTNILSLCIVLSGLYINNNQIRMHRRNEPYSLTWHRALAQLRTEIDDLKDLVGSDRVRYQAGVLERCQTMIGRRLSEQFIARLSDKRAAELIANWQRNEEPAEPV